MDNNVIVLDNVSIIYEHKLISFARAVRAVNSGEAVLELKSNGVEINMFIKENDNGRTDT